MTSIMITGSNYANVSLVGNEHVGKTSIVNQFVNQQFDEHYYPTIGPTHQEFHRSDQPNFKLNIYDTAGLERFRSMADFYLKSSQAIIFVYDISKHETFEELPYWLEHCNDLCGQTNALKILVGNKTDLPNQKVSKNEAQNFQHDYGFHEYYETSAKTGSNINELFYNLFDNLYSLSTSGDTSQTLDRALNPLQKEQTNSKKGCCK